VPKLRFLYALLFVASLVVSLTTGCSGGGGSTLPTVSSALSSATSPGQSSRATSVAVSASTPAGSTIGLSDSFSSDAVGGPATGWNVVTGTWSVCASGTSNAYCQTSSNVALALNGATWTDYTFSAVVTNKNLASGGIGIAGHVVNPNQFYLLELEPQKQGTQPYWYLLKINGLSSTVLGSGPLNAPDTNPNFSLQLSFSGSKIVASLAFDGGTAYQTLCSVTDTSYPSGQVGLRTFSATKDQFTNVLVTLPSAALPVESAVSSQSFVDSIGMNAHFDSPSYYQNKPAVSALVSGLGVRHYRVSAAAMLNGGSYASTLNTMYASQGIKFDVLSDFSVTAAQVIQAVQMLPAGSVEEIEGPNESDAPGQSSGYDPNFATDIPVYMQALYSAVKSNPATSQITVLGPSFANPSSYAAVGNLSAYVDAGNMHDYFAGFNPGTAGWGSNGYSFAPSLFYGSIAWNMAAAAQATGSKPVYATETGYYTAPITGGVPLNVQAKYVPRLYLEQYRHGVPRSFMYQLIGFDTTTAEGTLDIVSPSYAPSPAYTALAGLISAFGASSATQTATRNYNWTLAGQIANVDHLLVYKPDGTLMIPLWIETQSFNPNANGGLGAPVSVPQQSVTVTVSNVANSGTLWTCNPNTGAWSSAPVSLSNGSITLNVSDTVSMLQLPPS
jgi:hypothetical protein